MLVNTSLSNQVRIVVAEYTCFTFLSLALALTQIEEEKDSEKHLITTLFVEKPWLCRVCNHKHISTITKLKYHKAFNDPVTCRRKSC